MNIFTRSLGLRLLCVSRISREKNLEAFFKLKGHKIMVGDGPAFKEYEEKYKDVTFVGMKVGDELADYYRKADVFVFPSKTDTFGVVMIEAMACGTPVAAYPVPGPLDVVDHKKTGYLHFDLQTAALESSYLDRNVVYQNSKKWSWETSANQLLNELEKLR